MTKLAILAVSAVAVAASVASAQERPDLWVGTSASATTTRSAFAGGRFAFNGFVFAAAGRAALYGVKIHGEYAQGTLSLRDGDARRQYVEGYFFVGISPLPALPSLEFMAGPHVRTTISDAPLELPGTEDPLQHPLRQRWVLWEIRGRIDLPIYNLQAAPGTLRIFAEGRAAPFGSVNLPDPFDNARGGATGLELRMDDPRITARLAYAIDEIRLEPALRRETTEAITIAIGFAFGGPGAAALAALERQNQDR